MCRKHTARFICSVEMFDKHFTGCFRVTYGTLNLRGPLLCQIFIARSELVTCKVIVAAYYVVKESAIGQNVC